MLLCELSRLSGIYDLTYHVDSLLDFGLKFDFRLYEASCLWINVIIQSQDQTIICQGLGNHLP
jgi:hypothetical protein